jgi:hypothetical protein
MNLQTIATLMQIQQAIGETLTKEQQLFVSAEYPNFVAFLRTDGGKKALQDFMMEWQTAPK